jgi:hypothetical protein
MWKVYPKSTSIFYFNPPKQHQNNTKIPLFSYFKLHFKNVWSKLERSSKQIRDLYLLSLFGAIAFYPIAIPLVVMLALGAF